VLACALTDLRAAAATATTAERLFGVGSLFFDEAGGSQRASGGGLAAQSAWVHIARPAEVERLVNEAIQRAKARR
jgi:hypothetical protein